MKCIEAARKDKIPCCKKECRKWIDYPSELNCILETVKRAGSHRLTLRECSKRLNISFVRVKQIEDKALKKLKARDLTSFKD
jgi:hypothetical protein